MNAASSRKSLGGVPGVEDITEQALRERYRGDAPEDAPAPGPAPVHEGEHEHGPRGAQEAADAPAVVPEGGDTGGAPSRLRDGSGGVAAVLTELDRATKSYVAGLAKLQPRRDRLAAAIAAYLEAGGHGADIRSRFAASGIDADDIPREAREALRKR